MSLSIASDFMPPRIKYITFNNICKPTAMTNRALSIINALVEKGLEVEISCLATLNPQDEIPKDLNSKVPVTFYAKKSRIRFLSHLKSLIMFLPEILKEKNIIAYFYGYDALMEIYFLIIRIFKKFDSILEITEFPGYNRELNSIEKILFKKVLDKTDLVVVINNELERYVKQFTNTSTLIMNMTVDFSRFELKQPQNGNIITYCGSLSEIKDGTFSLIRAFSIFSKSVSETYKLRLIGDTSDRKLTRSLLDLCIAENVYGSVELTGSVERERIPGLLSESKMLVLCRPDSHQARGGFPTKLGEYLASGVPVVVTNVGEISCFLHDGISCFLAESSDPETFSQKMLEVVTNYEKAIQIGLKGKEVAKTAFSAKNETEKLITLMQSVIIPDRLNQELPAT